MRKFALVLAVLIAAFPIAAQETGAPAPGFSAGLNLGSDLLPTGTGGALESWSKLGFQPDLSIGKFGVGLDFTIRFKLYPNGTTPIEIYAPDWIPQSGQTVFDVYLPKIMYVRYGLRGVDPIYAKLGSISDFSLANGLVISDYANTRFLPDTRIFGLQAGLDGAAFKFPFIGLEVLTGNISKLDVVGGRVYIRPLAFFGKGIPGRIQIGATAVADRNPLLYIPTGDLGSYPASKLIYVLGADVTVPVMTGDLLSLTIFAEGAQEMNGAMGAIGGLRGKLIGIVKYGAQVRYLQEGFIPTYFDANYDLYRADRFKYIENKKDPGSFAPGWLANVGFTLFNNMFVFDATLDGPFAAIPSVATSNSSEYPHLKGSLLLKDGLIGGLSFEGGYEKYFIGGHGKPFLQDVIDPKDAVIGLAVHYKTGATVLTLNYAYRWDPSIDDWDVSSSLSASVRF